MLVDHPDVVRVWVDGKLVEDRTGWVYYPAIGRFVDPATLPMPTIREESESPIMDSWPVILWRIHGICAEAMGYPRWVGWAFSVAVTTLIPMAVFAAVILIF